MACSGMCWEIGIGCNETNVMLDVVLWWSRKKDRWCLCANPMQSQASPASATE